MKKYLWVGIVVVVAVVIGVVAMSSNNKSAKKSTNTNSTNTAALKFDQQVKLTDFAYDPNEFTVHSSQTIRILLNNTGKSAHSFVFDKLDFNSGAVEPGTSRVITITVPAAAGNYGFHSNGPDPKDKDMKGTLVVQ